MPALSTQHSALSTMSLFGALNIGRSALATQQAALQVTGNNIANAGDPNLLPTAVGATASCTEATASVAKLWAVSKIGCNPRRLP